MDKIEIYNTPDGGTAISVKLENETVWLSQAISTCAIVAQVRECH